MGAGEAPGASVDGESVLALYDAALGQVYGYFVRRVGERMLAEELTADTFLAAVDASRRDDPPALSVPWLIGVARHKLADHWRRQARSERNLQAVGGTLEEAEDPWDARLEAVAAQAALAQLAPTHRLVLCLRYVDDLTVPDVAALLGRSVHATEALLVRARRAFRSAYGTDAQEAGR